MFSRYYFDQCIEQENQERDRKRKEAKEQGLSTPHSERSANQESNFRGASPYPSTFDNDDWVEYRGTIRSKREAGAGDPAEDLVKSAMSATKDAVTGRKPYTGSEGLWHRVNPGFSDVQTPSSTYVDGFRYNQKTFELPDKRHFQKRDYFTEYNEARARFSLNVGKKPGQE